VQKSGPSTPKQKSYSKENDVMEQLNNNSRRSFLKAGSMLGLGAAFSQGMIGQPFANSQTIANHNQPIGQNGIRPFHVNVPEVELTELRGRIRAARWPEQPSSPDNHSHTRAVHCRAHRLRAGLREAIQQQRR
jgi:hypothetical protein